MCDNSGAFHEHYCQDFFWKKRESKCSKASMSNIDRSISFCTTNGSQNNEWKFDIHNTVKNDNINKSDLARKIR